MLLLTDVFKNFRKTCMQYYKLDPCHYFTSPGLSWDAILKMTNIKLELMTDSDMFQFIEKGMRGGASYIANRYGNANNKYMKEYNEKAPSKYIMYLDANNFYGWAISHYLPIYGITTDSKTFYIRLYHRKWMRQRGPQIGAPFKDQPYVKMLVTFNYNHAPLAHFVRSSHGLFTHYVATLLASTYALRLFYPLSCRGPIPSSTIALLCLRCRPLRNEGTIAITIILKNALVPPCYQIAPSYLKMRWYPHANKLLQKCAISNKAINMHSRRPTEQYFCVLEPHRGCLHKTKKVHWYPLIGEGQRNHKYAF